MYLYSFRTLELVLLLSISPNTTSGLVDVILTSTMIFIHTVYSTPYFFFLYFTSSVFFLYHIVNQVFYSFFSLLICVHKPPKIRHVQHPFYNVTCPLYLTTIEHQRWIAHVSSDKNSLGKTVAFLQIKVLSWHMLCVRIEKNVRPI